jgi:hypothetical protein
MASGRTVTNFLWRLIITHQQNLRSNKTRAHRMVKSRAIASSM